MELSPLFFIMTCDLVIHTSNWGPGVPEDERYAASMAPMSSISMDNWLLASTRAEDLLYEEWKRGEVVAIFDTFPPAPPPSSVPAKRRGKFERATSLLRMRERRSFDCVKTDQIRSKNHRSGLDLINRINTEILKSAITEKFVPAKGLLFETIIPRLLKYGESSSPPEQEDIHPKRLQLWHCREIF